MRKHIFIQNLWVTNRNSLYGTLNQVECNWFGLNWLSQCYENWVTLLVTHIHSYIFVKIVRRVYIKCNSLDLNQVECCTSNKVHTFNYWPSSPIKELHSHSESTHISIPILVTRCNGTRRWTPSIGREGRNNEQRGSFPVGGVNSTPVTRVLHSKTVVRSSIHRSYGNGLKFRHKLEIGRQKLLTSKLGQSGHKNRLPKWKRQGSSR